MLRCAKLFDGESGDLHRAQEIFVEDGTITDIGPSVARPGDAEVIGLGDRTVSPGFIDTHVHLTMDAATLPMQTLGSTATKALTGLSLAQGYLESGFTTLRAAVRREHAIGSDWIKTVNAGGARRSEHFSSGAGICHYTRNLSL